MEEIWKDVIGYEGKYQVSNQGQVRSLRYRNTDKVKVRRSSTTNKGYGLIILSKDNRSRSFRVHRLVYEAFNGVTELLVLHKDGNPQNNNIDNLYAGTQKQNIADSIKHGTHSSLSYKGENHPRATITWEQVNEIRRQSRSGRSISSIAKMLGIKHNTVWRVVNNRNWKERGTA